MDVIEDVKSILGETLGIGARAQALAPDSPLLGAIPEFDSMAVLTVLTAIEEHFDVQIEDDDVSAEIFETVGTLAGFVAQKVGG